jgi:Fe-S cluster assembly protein SufD
MNLSFTPSENFPTPQASSALEKAKALGLPTTKDEPWKYTSLKKFLNHPISGPGLECDLAQIESKLAQLPPCSNRLIFINGVLSSELTQLSAEVHHHTTSLHNTVGEDIFSMLRAASGTDTQHEIELKKNECTDLQWIFFGSHQSSTIDGHQLVLKIGEHAQVNLLSACFDLTSTNSFGTLPHFDIDLKAGSKLVFADLLHGSQNRWSIQERKISLSRDCELYYTGLIIGGELTRLNLSVTHNSTGSHSVVDGLYIVEKNQHADIYSSISHLLPNSTSSQLVKGILSDEARGIFTGKVVIARDAQHINAEQLNRNLLLSKKAHVFTRPQLEVDADDVKCAHGATVGQLNLDELFYLESRGFPLRTARKMLCHAFVQEIIEKLPHPIFSAWLARYVESEVEQTSEAFL